MGWIKNLNREQGVTELERVVAGLEHASTLAPVVQLWWLSGAVIEALQEQKLEPALSLNMVLGQIDRQIKSLIDEGELALAKQPPLDLIKNLLYFAALAEPGGERVDAVKSAFKLDHALPKEEEIEAARAGISGRNVEVMQAVTGALKEDLATIKDSLDLFVRSEQRETAALQPLADNLKRVGDTLGMLGFGHARKLVMEQFHSTEDMVQGSRPVDDAALMDIAGALLYVDSSLSGDTQQQLEEGGDEAAAGVQLPQAEIQQIHTAVLDEASKSLAESKEAITNYLEDSDESEPMTAVPQLLQQVQGALQVMNQPRAATMLLQATRYVEQQLIDVDELPVNDDQAALAEAIAGIELYMEGLAANRPHSNLLDAVEGRLTLLGCEEVALNESESTASTDAELRAEFSADVVSDDAPESAGLDEVSESLEESQLPEVICGEPIGTLRTEVTQTEESADFEFSDELDDEILDIFVEEAEEEYADIKVHLPRWLANPEDEESLTIIRRSFHTLKGSGRLVGANLVGEFAWSMENMLNRVIDNSVELSPTMSRLLESALDALPELLVQIKEGIKPHSDIKGLMAQAAAMSQPGEVEIPPLAAVPLEPALGHVEDEVAEAVPALKLEAESEPEPQSEAMDPVLYGIFRKESEGHFAEIHRFVDSARGGETALSESLARALHTLHGSAHMANANSIAELTGRMEQCVNAMMEAGVRADPSLLTLLEGVVTRTESILHLLDQADPEIPDYSDLLSRIDATQTSIEERQAEPVQKSDEEQSALSTAGEAAQVIELPTTQEQAFVEHLAEDEPDAELLSVFLEEGDEILESSDEIIQSWRSDPESRESVAALQRELHTLKGGARMAGLSSIGDLSHGLESLLTAIAEGQLIGTVAAVDLVQRALDRLHQMLSMAHRSERAEAADELLLQLEQMRRGVPNGAPQPELVGESVPNEELEAAPEESDLQLAAIEAPSEPVEADDQEAAVAAEAVSGDEAKRSQHEVVRVRADLLDDLVNYAGEASIYRSRLEQQVGTLGFNLQEMTQTAQRLQAQLRQIDLETEAQILSRHEQIALDQNAEFDPLEMDRYTHMQELSRALSETANDMVSIQNLLESSTRESETLLLQQSRVNTELQEGLMRSRMLPFSGLITRLRRLMRQTADTVGRDVGLFVRGAELELDRKVLDRIVAPLEHMLRNAIAHGIESPQQRQALGKSADGRVEISLAREGAEIVLSMKDDGCGIDVSQVREKAIERGLMRADSELDDHTIIQFILTSGFSTAQEVTQVAGRGVGMDVVNSEIKQLGGSLEIDSTQGEGSEFTIRMPLTLSVNRAIMVQNGEDIFAIPLTAVEGVTRISGKDMQRYQEDASLGYEYGGRTYFVTPLASLLGLASQKQHDEGRMYPMLLVRSGNVRVAVQIENLQGSREIVVKSVGPQIGGVPGVSGATILGDGRVVLILDIGAMTRQHQFDMEIDSSAAMAAAMAMSESDETLVMVVDDSITIRKVTSRLLERNQMNVFTAKDGVDAVAQLQERIPDVFLLDVEMPRMDGFELATFIRSEPQLKHIPIIMITSRTGEKHRARAFEIGVNRYLGKPYKEQELVENIREVLELDHESA
ncbi:Hpt domain-containing protein [Candidatus Reidiella endopervernicosa]|uniref:Chemotaxis protein CheA n=1 Tax=Candidatus Reidiella endopervernicosa TaxID=2738883 RepID=A0A6N0HRA7_9GAMM|nr:Hpt domain-containing protein [Candidatus Reidiella endopervernicosa]QKQ24884.1 Hpt domain-containing protein [Candidatus Reidiella endopervernicosa]